jgi:hypothetical protein
LRVAGEIAKGFFADLLVVAGEPQNNAALQTLAPQGGHERRQAP